MRSSRAWLTLALATSLVPVLGLFTTSRIFFVRDLGLFFWSRHLWFRHTIAAGTLPAWDPYVAAGQSAIADALNQLLMPLTLAVRLLPSDVISFNLWVALPLPLAAAGTWLFLRRTLEPEPAALGTVLFAASGPLVSTLNAPNLSWSVAAMPWVFWSVDRLLDLGGPRPLAVAAITIALQALAGEPVTFAATIVVLVVLASRRSGFGLGITMLAVVMGVVLAAAQLVPTVVAGVRAHRDALGTPDFWSLHPLMLLETVLPHPFGNYYDAFLADMPWMSPLNSGREPFYYSLYVGPIAILLAVTGLVTKPRRVAPWAAIAFAFAVAAMGRYTPVYPLARRLIPGLAFFRFPVKYVVVSVFAIAVMAAEGWAAAVDRAARKRVGRTGVGMGGLATACAALILAAIAVTPTSLRAAAALARSMHVADASAGAAYLMRTVPPLAARSAGLLLAGSALLVLIARHSARSHIAALLLLAAGCADVVITNADLNPTSPVVKMSPPWWYTSIASSQRLYIGGRVRGYMNGKDQDGTSIWEIPAESSAVEGRLELNAEIPMAPSGWGVREVLSYDLPVLWPAEYEAAVRRFEHASLSERAAFLRRSGVRWCVWPEDRGGFSIVASVPDWHMRVYQCDATATRAIISSRAEIGSDARWQREALFDPSLPDDDLRLEAAAPLAGRAGDPVANAAVIVNDAANELRLEAGLARDGYLLVRDSYDPSWRADVDGQPAVVVRANGLYRAIRLPPGRHVIRFEYRPREVAVGLMVSGCAALGLLVLLIRGAGSGQRRATRRERDSRGFTLVELMVVIAIIGILLALAFARYHNMQARANEASAIASLRSIAAAEWQFAQTCANQKYAASLTALGQPAPATGQAFLSPDLTSADIVRHSGYDFRIAAKPLDDAPPACNGSAVSAGYAATADPVTPGQSGTRFFAVNADRILYEDPSETFTEKMPESGAPPHGTELKTELK